MEEMEKKQDMERLREELNHWLAEEESDDDWKWLKRGGKTFVFVSLNSNRKIGNSKYGLLKFCAIMAVT
ncbi:hypothetical protein [Geobacillus thermodenitrificans]|uniref:hypothetical protein n=1 Tax=Geobacillus thermodenitrificans TaxID=33940 RepID=UPI001E43441E|nr:hypothetical protein [Geobacillus thermodenitrificans]